MSYRLPRVNQLIKEQISQLLLREIDFNNVLVTVIQVETSPDLNQSKIKISVLPNGKSQTVLRIIEKNIYFLQQALNKQLQMRPVPKIIFEIDQGQTNSQHIEEILDKIKKG